MHEPLFLQDSELAELRAAMEALKQQSLQAGIGTGLARQPSSDSVSSLSSACSLDKHEKKKKKGWVRNSCYQSFEHDSKLIFDVVAEKFIYESFLKECQGD